MTIYFLQKNVYIFYSLWVDAEDQPEKTADLAVKVEGTLRGARAEGIAIGAENLRREGWECKHVHVSVAPLVGCGLVQIFFISSLGDMNSPSTGSPNYQEPEESQTGNSKERQDKKENNF